MKPALIVTEPFGRYQRGDQIVDKKEIAAVLASENSASVNRAQVGDQPSPDVPADPAPK